MPTRFPETDPWNPPGGETPPELVEWEKLAPIHPHFEKPTYDNYREFRSLFLGKFGLEQDGPEVAIQRALA